MTCDLCRMDALDGKGRHKACDGEWWRRRKAETCVVCGKGASSMFDVRCGPCYTKSSWGYSGYPGV